MTKEERKAVIQRARHALRWGTPEEVSRCIAELDAMPRPSTKSIGMRTRLFQRLFNES